MHATDALAVAICHHFQNGLLGAELIKSSGKKTVKGWDNFVKNNPGRVK